MRTLGAGCHASHKCMRAFRASTGFALTSEPDLDSANSVDSV